MSDRNLFNLQKMDETEEIVLEEIPIDECGDMENAVDFRLLPGTENYLSIQDILKDKLESEIDKGICCPNELTNNSAFNVDMNNDSDNQSNVDMCYVCASIIVFDDDKHYIFSKNDQEMIKQSFDGRQSNRILSKLICTKCLNEYYIASDSIATSMKENDFLVVKSNSQIVYQLRDPEKVPQMMARDNKTITTVLLNNTKSNNNISVVNKKRTKKVAKNNNQIKSYQCHICLKQINRKSRLKLHIQRHESVPKLAKVFTCSKCKLAFKDLLNAQEHVNAEECNNSSFKQTNSDILPSEFIGLDSSKLTNSKNNNSKELLFNSNIFLNDTLDTKIGVEVVEISEVYICEYCDKVYCEKSSLKNHLELHQGLKNPFKCYCGQSFPTYSRCSYHKNCHKLKRLCNKYIETSDVNMDIQNEKFPVVKLFLCEICEMTFFDRSYFIEHRKVTHSAKAIEYKCKVCEKLFCHKWSLRRHNIKNHKENNGMDSNSDERLNLKIISNEPSYHCTECGNTYIHSSGLRTHKNRMHKREANIACPKCNKMFYEACDMEKHLAIHFDERPFSCDICKKAFRNKNAINEHSKVHSDERPFSCDICGMAFKRSRAVKSHRLIHAKNRYSKCPHCLRNFKSHTSLKTHVQQCSKTKEKEMQFEIGDSISALDTNLNMTTMLIGSLPVTNDIIIDNSLLECQNQVESSTQTEEMSSILLDNPQDIVYIQDDNITDGSYLISYENDIFSQMSEGDYLIFNDNPDEDMIWNN